MKLQNKSVLDGQNVFGQGMSNIAFARYFIGNSY